ncbi:hypothetical protein [Stieleria mannarensis]|uniref:hypothetical protein n=1 Tax=Stieleria mannarensis TaxID=2755585 RepID=UPI0016010F96|nr:hypothetical protein [Rhodopirellula sp. JC639]
MQDVDWLLCEICEAFGFPADSRYQFSPDDQLNEIYRSRYPRWKFWELGDSLELETLAMGLEKWLGDCGPKLFVIPLREIAERVTAGIDATVSPCKFTEG